MGFYGNTTDTSKIHFQFDKIYSNRCAMDNECSAGEDSIYTGRFVLVKYDSGNDLPANSSRIIYGFMKDNASPDNENCFTIYADKSYTIPYVYSNNNGNLGSNQVKDKTIVFRRRVYESNQEEVIEGKFYICESAYNTNNTTARWKLIGNYKNFGSYITNFQIDYEAYRDPRGYDGTVWEKVYSEGVGKFILVARLNGIAPNFELSEAPPLQLPAAAYVDPSSSDDFYKIKVPTHWGFRFKEVEEGKPSDQQITQPYYRYDENSHQLEVINKTINADVYFNLNKDKGSNYINRYKVKDNQTENEILINPSGESGKIYYDKNGNEIKKDSYELSIHLPIIGNMISDGYDLIYGENSPSEDEIGNQIITRPLDINWYDATATQEQKENGEIALNGKSRDLNTLAGVLNEMHDRLGQIIVKKDSYPSFEEIQGLNKDYIYEITADNNEKLYYYKDIDYEYEEVLDENISYDIADNIDIENYQLNSYYVKLISNSELIIADQPFSFYQNNIDNYENNNGKVVFYKKNITTSQYQEIELLAYEHDKYYYYNDNSKDYLLDHHRDTPSYPKSEYYDINIIKDSETGEILAKGDILSIRTFSKTYNPNQYYQFINNSYQLITDLLPNEQMQYYQINSSNVGGTSENNKKILYQKNKYFYYINGQPALATDEYNPSLIYYYIPLKLDEISYVQSSSGEMVVGHPLDMDNIHRIPSNKIFGASGEIYAKKGSNYIPSSKIIDPLEENQYCTITSIDITDEIFIPNKYYTYDENGFHFAREYGTSSTKYYQLKPIYPLSIPFYEPDNYWYNTGNLFVIDHNITKTNQTYYTETALYVLRDSSGRFKKGYKWKNQALYVPASVVLATKRKVYNLFSLVGINNGDSSLNGSIKKINTLIADTNKYTREVGTVQGALNTIEDNFNLFYATYPGRILYVNDFGQLTATNFTLTQLQQMANDIDNLKNRIATLEN